MSLFKEEEFTETTVLEVAKLMVVSARTAPKTKGRDNIFTAIVTGAERERLAARMKEIGETTAQAFFVRDAQCVLQSKAVVLIGVRIKTNGLQHCGYCGFGNCETKETKPEVPCTFNNIDLGIAVGSAAGIAGQHHVDNRIMYSAGKAALALGFIPEAAVILAIPLSVSAKSPFFDRA